MGLCSILNAQSIRTTLEVTGHLYSSHNAHVRLITALSKQMRRSCIRVAIFSKPMNAEMYALINGQKIMDFRA